MNHAQATSTPRTETLASPAFGDPQQPTGGGRFEATTRRINGQLDVLVWMFKAISVVMWVAAAGFAALMFTGCDDSAGDPVGDAGPAPQETVTRVGCTVPAGSGFARYSTGLLAGVVDVPFVVDAPGACSDLVPAGPRLPAGYQQAAPTRLAVEWGNNDIATGNAVIDYTFTDADGQVTPWTFTFAVEVYTGSRGIRQ